MIDLANKCVLVRTQEEYESVLKEARRQGYRWYGGKEAYPYPFKERQIPDILKFYCNKEMTRNASLEPGYELVEASDVVIDEKKLAEWLEELKSYKNAEEQGLLVRFPCKVGNTVWVVTSPINVFDYDEYDGDAKYEVYESFLSSVSYYTSGEQFRIYAKVTNSFIAAYFRECDFGESIFLTREEAEKKLEEMKNGKK